MTDPKHVLFAVDDSEGSMTAVRHAANFLRHAVKRVTLLHVLDGEPPPELREHEGSERPDEEQSLDDDLRTRRRRWLEARARNLPSLDRARAILTSSGVKPEAIETVAVPSPDGQIPVEILDTAERLGCGTVVVGKGAYPWYRELGHEHVGDWLIDHGAGIGVMVVT